MSSEFASKLEERLVRYCRVDTQSDESTGVTPSTAIQFDLLRMLEQELRDMGAQDVRLTETGFVLATIPATIQTAGAVRLPVVAFFGHVDTAPQFNAAGVKPIVHRAYSGGDIVLPDDPAQVISPSAYPYLGTKVGHDIVTASGTTLLGADDKAGVAIVMTMAEHLLRHPEIAHGDIRVCFTPDEEIGTGIRALDLKELGADFAYTLDGGEVGELSYETFSADKAVVKITGVSIHPGDATGVMVNAIYLAAKILTLLPSHARTPDTTSGKQGFIHAYSMEGSVGEATISFILRDFELDGLAAHAALLRQVCAAVQATEPRSKIDVTVTKQYRNMRYWLEQDMRPVEKAVEAMRRAGVEPKFEPVRGGTDGSQLTESGLPTPNIFTGMQNVHGPLEYISVQDMAQAAEVCVALAQLWAE